MDAPRTAAPSIEPATSHSASLRLAILGLLFACAGCAALWIDRPLAKWLAGDPIRGEAAIFIRLAEVFAHGNGVLLIALGVMTLDPRGFRLWPRFIFGVLGAGLFANLLKFTAGRMRPFAFDLETPIANSFLGWFAALSNSQLRSHAYLSFPSGHTATAVALAIVLGTLYPRGRYYFAFIAALAAFQRLHSGSHFLSDTLWGAAAACLWCALIARRATRDFHARYEAPAGSQLA